MTSRPRRRPAREILQRVETGSYPTRYALMRDVALNLFWVNRFALTMYEKRPTRWARRAADPRRRVPAGRDSHGRTATARSPQSRRPTPCCRPPGTPRRRIGSSQCCSTCSATASTTRPTLPAIKPTVAEILAAARSLTFRLPAYDPDYPVYGYDDILDCTRRWPSSKRCTGGRWCCTTSTRGIAREVRAGRGRRAARRRLRGGRSIHGTGRSRAVPAPAPRRRAAAALGSRARPATAADRGPTHRSMCGRNSQSCPSMESLAVVHGEHVCTNDDLIRNSAYNWSPMTRGGDPRQDRYRGSRKYTAWICEEIALHAAQAALTKAGREPRDIGAVLLCTCTSTRMIPSVATWMSRSARHRADARLLRHGRCLRRACRTGSREATRLLQEVQPAGAGRVRREVLGQDRERAAVADDLR